MPLHIPGFRYCGPGTNVKKSDKEGGPVNELDAICRTHDLDLENPLISQLEADQRFIDKAPSTGLIGNALSSIIAAKSLIAEAQPGINNYLPGHKENHPLLRKAFSDSSAPFNPKHTSTPIRRPDNAALFRARPVGHIQKQTSAKDSGFASQSSQPQKRKGSYTDQFNKRLKQVQTDPEESQKMGSQPDANQGTMQVQREQNTFGMSEPQGTMEHQKATKQIVMKYSRTLRHYVTLPAELDNSTKQGWSDIPYQHICASLKPSDWQGLNTFARRWTILKCGFVLHHIIPIEYATGTSGGAIVPKVIYQTQPYMETFIDEDMILPMQQIYTDNPLPNTNMSINTDVASKSQLTHIEWEKTKIQPSTSNDGYKAFSKKYTNMELMDSWSWNTILPSETFSYTWQAQEIKWRHGMKPASGVTGIETPASYLGRWDGGERLTDLKANYNYTSQALDNYEKPAPTTLVRPMQVYGTNDTISNVGFMVLITYTSEVLIDINDVRFFPLFNAIPKDENDDLIDIYHSNHATKKDAWKQWPGSNCHMIVSGPTKHGNLI